MNRVVVGAVNLDAVEAGLSGEGSGLCKTPIRFSTSSDVIALGVLAPGRNDATADGARMTPSPINSGFEIRPPS